MKKAESITNLVLPDGIVEVLQGNIEAQYGVKLSEAVLGILIDLTRKTLASQIESLVDGEVKKL